VKQLVDAEPQQIEQVTFKSRNTAVHAVGENCVDCSSLAKHSIHELTQPTPVTCIEISCAPIECSVEHLAGAYVRANLRRRDARGRHAAYNRELEVR
jgi:hypothetical protein